MHSGRLHKDRCGVEHRLDNIILLKEGAFATYTGRIASIGGQKLPVLSVLLYVWVCAGSEHL